MRITSIRAYRVELPLHETTYKWSGGKSVTVFDSTIVRVDTDSGLVGYGEVCPLGPLGAQSLPLHYPAPALERFGAPERLWMLPEPPEQQQRLVQGGTVERAGRRLLPF